MQLRRLIVTVDVHSRDGRPRGRRGWWYLQGHSMLSTMVSVQSVEHHLRPNDRQHQNEREVLITRRYGGSWTHCKAFRVLYCRVCLQVVVRVNDPGLEVG